MGRAKKEDKWVEIDKQVISGCEKSIEIAAYETAKIRKENMKGERGYSFATDNRRYKAKIFNGGVKE